MKSKYIYKIANSILTTSTIIILLLAILIVILCVLTKSDCGIAVGIGALLLILALFFLPSCDNDSNNNFYSKMFNSALGPIKEMETKCELYNLKESVNQIEEHYVKKESFDNIAKKIDSLNETITNLNKTAENLNKKCESICPHCQFRCPYGYQHRCCCNNHFFL